MKPPPRHHPHHLLLLALLCAGAGIVAGYFLNPARLASSQEKKNTAASTSNSPRTGPRVLPATDDNEPHDFKGLKRLWWRTNQGEGNPAVSSELARLDISVLREMAAGIADDVRQDFDSSARSSRHRLLKASVQELYHREGIAVMEWAAALPDPETRSLLMGEALAALAAGNPIAAKAWDDPFGDKELGVFRMDLPTSTLRGAVPRGADALIEAVDLYPGNASYGPYPEDFDFARLHAVFLDKGRVILADGDGFAYWVSRDKDAAWRALKLEIGGSPTAHIGAIGSIIHGAIAKDGEVEGMRWAMERLRELTPQQQLSAMSQLDDGGKLTREGIATALPELSQPQREQLAAHLTADLTDHLATHLTAHRGGETKLFAVLDTLPRESIVEALATGIHEGPYGYARQRHAFFGEATQRYSFTPAEKARIGKGEAHADAPSENR